MTKVKLHVEMHCLGSLLLPYNLNLTATYTQLHQYINQNIVINLILIVQHILLMVQLTMKNLLIATH
jgi:hypothetical protein